MSIDSKSTDRSAYQKGDTSSDQRFNLASHPDRIRQYLFLSGSGGNPSPLNGSKVTNSLGNTFSPKTISQGFELN